VEWTFTGKRRRSAFAGAAALELNLNRRRILEGDDHVENQLLLALRLHRAYLRRFQIVNSALQLLGRAQLVACQIIQRAHGRQRTHEQLLGVIGWQVTVHAAEQAALGAQRSLHSNT
jgi:hypothetical protein